MPESKKRKKPPMWEPLPFAAVPGPVPDGDLHIRTVGVAGMERSYWSPTQQPRGEDVPLLIALHGLGMTGRHMALGTKLSERAPAAGFHVVFPDALERCWDDHGCGRRDGGDDGLFMRGLVEHLRRRREVADSPVLFAGVGSGAAFAERVVRAGLVETAGLALVGGSARRASVEAIPEPRQAAPLLIMCGEPPQDRVGIRVRRSLTDPRGHEMVPVEQLISNWETANHAAGKPVQTIRLAGHGDGWPGGSGKLRSRQRAQDQGSSDATSRVLEFARSVLA